MYRLLVSTTAEDRRVALVEGGVLRELHTERRHDRGLVGNVYKGRIVRVLPGLDAAFVEIGIGRGAFLQWDDAGLLREAVPDAMIGEEPDAGSHADGLDTVPPTLAPLPAPIVGQDVLVQVTRDAFGGKGPRLSLRVSLPGRTLVYLPTTPILGVSRRIADEAERSRLRDATRSLLTPGAGAILRTAAQNRPESELAEDLAFLSALWASIQSREPDSEAPALLHEDLDLLLRAARDHLGPECEGIVVDTEEDYDRLLQFVDTFMPHCDDRVTIHRGTAPIFEAHGVDAHASGVLDRVVWLKAGGSIVIDHTEALTAIDVNTGGTAGRGDPEETIFQTNLDAAREIACQLRLRNIGGIVVIDFIDMRDPVHRQQVQAALEAGLAVDKAHFDILPMSRLGLVELTRKRPREASFSRMTEPCPYCEGRGWVRGVEYTCSEIIRRLSREAATETIRSLRVMAHPRVIEALIDGFRTSLADLETRWQKPVHLVRREDFHLEQWNVRPE
jgi:ribonuclease G